MTNTDGMPTSTPDDHQVRKVGAQDLEALCRLYNDTTSSTLSADDAREWFQEQLASPAGFYLVTCNCRYAGDVAAVFALTELAELLPTGRRRFIMHGLRVGPEFVGTNLMETIYSWLHDVAGAGVDFELIALASIDRLRAIDAYRKHGLTESHRGFTLTSS